MSVTCHVEACEKCGIGSMRDWEGDIRLVCYEHLDAAILSATKHKHTFKYNKVFVWKVKLLRHGDGHYVRL